jgi:hypothetical protein
MKKILFALSLMAFCCPGWAQEITGDIRGIVKDPSGAHVGGASVQVMNTDRNAVIRDLKTGSDGSYVATYLPTGHYKVTVNAQGFAPYTANNITVNVNDRLVVDAQLKLTGSTQEVNVTESATQVDLDTSTASGLITGTQIRELSIASRNYEQLVALQPGVSSNLGSDQLNVGVSSPTGTSNQINFSFNGNRPTQNNWTIDGADNVDRGANLTLLAYPSVDSIAEFRVLRANYLPEHGRSSSGEITVITRSGTNQFHGSAYEFFRNDKLNANNYFNNNAGIERPELRWNDFGFTIGGPIIKNKTFFFYSQEWRKIITYNTFTSGELPTPAEMAGNFPVAVCTQFDAAGENCIAQGTTVSAINPVAQQYINDIYSKLPAANNADGSLTWVGRNLFNYREENVRVDHTFNSKLSIFGRYLDDSIPTQEPAGLFTGLGVPDAATTSTNSPGRNAAIHATWTISQNLLADMGYAYSYGAVVSHPIGLLTLQNSPDIQPTLPFGLAERVPDLNFVDGQGLATFGPYLDYNYNHNFFATVSKVFGHHATKYGFSFNSYSKDENVNGFGGRNGAYNMSDFGDTAPADGTFQQEWANFLTGNVANFTQNSIDFRALVYQKQFELFAQDEWRIRPNLTMDYGVRYSMFRAPTYGNKMLTTFDPSLYSASAAPALDSDGLYVAGTQTPVLNGLSIGGQNSPYGDAVSRTPKMNFAPRLGFAWDPTGTGKTSVRTGFGIFFDSPAVTTVETYAAGNPPFVNTVSLSNALLNNPSSGVADVNLAPPVLGGPTPNWKQPYSEMWNLDIQHELGRGMMVDIGYYGNVGRHLLGIVDINMPHPGDFQSIVPVIPSPVSLGNTQKLNQVRPYKGYDAINTFDPVFSSNYNGLQAQFQKQFTDGSLIVLNYTWSHALGTATSDFRSPQNTYDIQADYGPLDFDRRHIFTGNYVYNLPFFKSQQGVAGHVLGGWELSGIVYLNTGSHLTVAASSDPAGLALRGNTNSGGRPDLVGDPNNGPKTIANWFNKNAFALVPAGQIRPGDEPRGTVVGPGYARWDASLFKNFKLTERFGMQFRAETFNVLNHVNFNNPNVTFTSSSFAKILTARDPRNIQLALKLLF